MLRSKLILERLYMNLEMENTNPVELLFGNYRRQVLALLLLRPEQSYHVREIARLTNVSAGSLHRELKLLQKVELLLSQPVGNQIHYRANRESPIFSELASIFRKTTGLADYLRQALAPMADSIDLSYIFGSVAQGKERSFSVVDVLVVGDIAFNQVVEILAQTQEHIRREVNPVVMLADIFRKKYAEGDRFVTRIIKEPKIFLQGNADDLGKLVEDRTIEKS